MIKTCLSNITLVGQLILLLASCSSIPNKKGDVPTFDLMLSDSSTIFNTSQIPSGKPFILIYFSPDCEHCQSQTNSILQTMDSLKSVTFYFITNDPFDRIKIFNTYYKIYNYKNIILGRDYAYSFPKYFKSVSPPYLVLYDPQKRLRAVFKGETKPTKIIEFLNVL